MTQLGLKLERRERLMPTVVVDHIEPLGWQN